MPETTVVTANTEYEWKFTTNDSANYEEITGIIILWEKVASSGGSGGGGGSSSSTTVSNKGDSTVADTSSGNITESKAEQIIEKAEKNDSDEIVIDSSKDKVTLPTGMIEEIAEKTDADLVIETKNGSVTIPHDVLEKLETEGKVTITVTEDGVTITDENGEVILDDVEEPVPVEPETPAEPEEQFFQDVKADDWFAPAVQYVYENGMMSGVDEDNFGPTWHTTRGMITTIIWRMEGKPEAGQTMTFKDVPADMYYADAIAWAAENGIVSGYDAVTFAPDDLITREQLAAILYRYEQYNGGGFEGMWMFLLDHSDRADISEYAYEAMCWCVMNGIMSGNDNGTLNPQGHAQRAHAAQMLMKFMENAAE